MDATQVWNEYQAGVDHHNQVGLYTETEQAHRLFEGDQWYGVDAGGDSLPQLNFVQPLVEYKTAMVAQNTMNITFSPMEYGGDRKLASQACELLNKYARRQWELLKLDTKSWNVVRDACISGDSLLYFYDNKGSAQVIDRTNVYFSDENNPDVQSQKYILISERRFVSDVKNDAVQNMNNKDSYPDFEVDIDLIVPDEITEHELGDEAKQEVKGPERKCLSILRIWKESDGIHFLRAIKNVIYQPETVIPGLFTYPIAFYVWMHKKGSSRGIGEVTAQKANQIEANKNLYRRAIAAKISAFPKLLYNSSRITDLDSLTKIGAAIPVTNAEGLDVTKLVSYIMPAQTSPDAAAISGELIDKNMELAGAGDSATGQINPEEASGSAIMAARDQAAIPLNQQIADYKQFIEDIASIWYDMWVAYNPNGMEVTDEETGAVEIISSDVLSQMKVNIRIDVSPADPISKMARNKFLENLFINGKIELEEYVDSLDEDSPAPKGKLQDIINKRQQRALQQQALQQQLLSQFPQPQMLPQGVVQ